MKRDKMKTQANARFYIIFILMVLSGITLGWMASALDLDVTNFVTPVLIASVLLMSTFFLELFYFLARKAIVRPEKSGEMNEVWKLSTSTTLAFSLGLISFISLIAYSGFSGKV